MEIRKKQPLGIELVRRGIVDGEAIERAIQYQMEHPNKRIGDILYILKEADPERLVKEIADIIEIESYKKYNLESDENVEENQNDKNENKDINEEKTETKQRCCNIF